MGSERNRAIRELRNAEAASAELRESLRATEGRFKQVRERLERRASLEEALSGVDLPRAREQLTSNLQHFEQARYRMRLAAWSLGDKEGHSASELARLWGFSRQLGAKLLRDARSEK